MSRRCRSPTRKIQRASHFSSQKPAIPVTFVIEPVLASGGRIPRAAQPRPLEPAFLHLYVLSEERGGLETKELDYGNAWEATPGALDWLGRLCRP